MYTYEAIRCTPPSQSGVHLRKSGFRTTAQTSGDEGVISRVRMRMRVLHIIVSYYGFPKGSPYKNVAWRPAWPRTRRSASLPHGRTRPSRRRVADATRREGHAPAWPCSSHPQTRNGRAGARPSRMAVRVPSAGRVGVFAITCFVNRGASSISTSRKRRELNHHAVSPEWLIV